MECYYNGRGKKARLGNATPAQGNEKDHVEHTAVWAQVSSNLDQLQSSQQGGRGDGRGRGGHGMMERPRTCLLCLEEGH